LLGTVVARGAAPDLAILSDDAGQFDVLTHALCRIHAERVLAKLLGFNEPQRQALASVRSELWAIYDALNAYKEAPDASTAAAIEARFEKLCATRTGYASLDQALKRMRRNREELLRVLQRPELPLHNNLSESDIRDYVKKRKISGSTRSQSGRRCRDTFTSLRKTCRKNGLPFRTASSAGIGLPRLRSGSSRPPGRRRGFPYMAPEAALRRVIAAASSTPRSSTRSGS